MLANRARRLNALTELASLQAKKRLSGRKRKSEKKGAGEGEDGQPEAGVSDDDEGPLDYLTPVQLKVGTRGRLGRVLLGLHGTPLWGRSRA